MSLLGLVIGCCVFGWQPAPTATETTPLEFKPYRVVFWLDIEDSPRYSPTIRHSVQREIEQISERLLGKAWELKFPAPPTAFGQEAPPSADVTKPLAADADKILWVRVFADPSAGRGNRRVLIKALEYDVQFANWGAAASSVLEETSDLGRQCFRMAHQQFRPLAKALDAQKEKEIEMAVQGMALCPLDSPLGVVQPNAPFKVFRDYYSKGELVKRLPVPWTYLAYRRSDARKQRAMFDVASSLGMPLGGRVNSRNQVTAIAVAMRDDAQTEVRFMNSQDKRPIVGFEVTARPYEKRTTLTIGNTDHRGAIVLRPMQLTTEQPSQRTAQLLDINLLVGQAVIASFPMVPGDEPVRNIQASIDPLVTEVNGRVYALQEELIDSIAMRVILQARLKAMEQANDAPGLKAIADQINAMPDKPHFEKKLDGIEEFAEKRRAEANRTKLGHTIRKLLAQTRAMLDHEILTGKVTLEETKTSEPPGAAKQKAEAPKAEEKPAEKPAADGAPTVPKD